MTEDEMVGWHHRLNRHEFEQIWGDSEGQGSQACCSPWGCKESDVTYRLNNNNAQRTVGERWLIMWVSKDLAQGPTRERVHQTLAWFREWKTDLAESSVPNLPTQSSGTQKLAAKLKTIGRGKA